MKEHYSTYISLYLKYPHSSDGFLGTLFKENKLRFVKSSQFCRPR